jgi:outer membrane protein
MRAPISASPRPGAVASGLPADDADGGWKNWRATLRLAQTLTGDLRHPGLSLFGGLSCARLKGSIARSPVVALAGDRDQYFAIAGLSYSF